MDPKNLKELVADYEYGQFNILDNGMKISYNPKTRQVKLDPFYHYDAHPKRGSCGELMSTAYLEIRDTHPDLHVTRVTGNDPNFYRNSDAKHCFLFVSEQDLMGGKYYSHEPEDIEQVIEQDPLMVDPSFKTVVPFSESGYKVQRLMNQGCKVSYSNRLVLPHNSGVPLGVDTQGDIVYLMANLDTQGALDIGLQSSGSSILQYRLEDTALVERLTDDPKIMRFVELLKERERFESRTEFKEENDIIIE